MKKEPYKSGVTCPDDVVEKYNELDLFDKEKFIFDMMSKDQTFIDFVFKSISVPQ